MSRITTAILALLFAGLSAGFGLCMSIVHYHTWSFVPQSAFREFQNASAIRTIPLAIALGISSLLLSAITAYRGLPGVARPLLWLAVALAAMPWVATPTVMTPLQARLAAEGPVAGLVAELVWKDLVLRSLPPTIQSIILLLAVVRSKQSGDE
jgi:asparagine N-glycosylation enzyme membrane subunit Stt3